ncbi:hypothetical protein [Ralstonia pseudosolanacearum]
MMRTILLALCFVLVACSQSTFEESDCSNQLVSSATSANGQLVASLVRRDCGATAAYSNLVFLKKSSDAIGKVGTWGETVYVSEGDTSIAIEWHGAELWVKPLTTVGRVFLKRENWDGVRIVYK